jgi:outer membrane protein
MSNISKTAIALSVAGLAALMAAPAAMAEKGDWIIRGGATMVDPKSNNLRLGTLEGEGLTITDTVLNVDEGTSFGFNITYMVTDNIGIELLAAAPFKHDVDLCGTIDGERGCGQLAEVEHLPPTLSVQYRFMPDSKFQPYVGVGINLTLFDDEKFTNDLQAALEDLGLAGAGLELDDSTGIAAQIGADFFFGERWLINADIRYIEIQPDLELTLDGESITLGTVKIDPMVYSIMVGYRF